MYVAIYTTINNLENAKALGKALVEEKLVACINLIPIHSIYRWEGQIQEEPEVLIWGKTQDFLIDEIKEFIHKRHSYDTPAFVVFPIQDGCNSYLQWITESTKKKP